MSEAGHSRPTATDRIGRQFSMLALLLGVLAACVTAAYFGERRRRVAAERGAIERQEQTKRLSWFAGPPKPLPVFPGADPRLVHIKSVPPSIGARDEPGWAWKVYLPEGDWWLYLSQGEKYDEALGKYRESVSGCQIKGNGELDIYGCLTSDFERGRWIQNWAGGASQAAKLSEAGLAVKEGPGQTTRVITGDSSETTSPTRPMPHGRIQLLRWHKVLDAQNQTHREYGFSIYLVEESPTPGAKPKSK